MRHIRCDLFGNERTGRLYRALRDAESTPLSIVESFRAECNDIGSLVEEIEIHQCVLSRLESKLAVLDDSNSNHTVTIEQLNLSKSLVVEDMVSSKDMLSRGIETLRSKYAFHFPLSKLIVDDLPFTDGFLETALEKVSKSDINSTEEADKTSGADFDGSVTYNHHTLKLKDIAVVLSNTDLYLFNVVNSVNLICLNEAIGLQAFYTPVVESKIITKALSSPAAIKLKDEATSLDRKFGQHLIYPSPFSALVLNLSKSKATASYLDAIGDLFDEIEFELESSEFESDKKHFIALFEAAIENIQASSVLRNLNGKDFVSKISEMFSLHEDGVRGDFLKNVMGVDGYDYSEKPSSLPDSIKLFSGQDITKKDIPSNHIEYSKHAFDTNNEQANTLDKLNSELMVIAKAMRLC